MSEDGCIQILLVIQGQEIYNNRASNKSKIVPYFEYDDIFLMNINQKTKTKLQRLQNGALRIYAWPWKEEMM